MNSVKFSDLTLKQKIGQLIIANPKKINFKWLNLELGGIFVKDKNLTEKQYKKIISYYQKNSKIPIFVSTDMEGYWNPFKFYKSKTFGQIKNKKEALELGKNHGITLKKLGFNLNFSPVVEIRNNVWKGRSFTGSEKEIEEKIVQYIKGLQSKNIMATAKHYPGGNLVRDPHIFRFKIKTDKREIKMFDVAIKSNVDGIMTGHPKVYGDLDSKGKQVTISREVIGNLRKKFKGLIITDAVTMFGLRWSYLWNFKKSYPDLILAGNNIILDSATDSRYCKIKKRINYLIKISKTNPELMKKIDESCKLILRKKGYKIIE